MRTPAAGLPTADGRAPYFDAVMGKAAAEGMAKQASLLFGRRTYEDFYKVWPNRGNNPFTQVLNNSRKYVVSTTLEDPLPWQNSILLKGDAAVAVTQLKKQSDDLVVLGSVALVQSLMQHKLVDEYVLSIHPLGAGIGLATLPGWRPLHDAQFDRQQDDDHRGRDGHLSACLPENGGPDGQPACHPARFGAMTTCVRLYLAHQFGTEQTTSPT